VHINSARRCIHGQTRRIHWRSSHARSASRVVAEGHHAGVMKQTPLVKPHKDHLRRNRLLKTSSHRSNERTTFRPYRQAAFEQVARVRAEAAIAAETTRMQMATMKNQLNLLKARETRLQESLVRVHFRNALG
jgi:hypothetical protein